MTKKPPTKTWHKTGDEWSSVGPDRPTGALIVYGSTVIVMVLMVLFVLWQGYKR